MGPRGGATQPPATLLHKDDNTAATAGVARAALAEPAFVPDTFDMECRVGCGACCIAISLSSPLPGHPQGKPAGVPCRQLTRDNHCALFGHPERPQVCADLQAQPAMCGDNRSQALARLHRLEIDTQPD